MRINNRTLVVEVGIKKGEIVYSFGVKRLVSIPKSWNQVQNLQIPTHFFQSDSFSLVESVWIGRWPIYLPRNLTLSLGQDNAWLLEFCSFSLPGFLGLKLLC